eukprot:XP_016874123.1 collagen alpha-1(I) chain [Homo sapiens]
MSLWVCRFKSKRFPPGAVSSDGLGAVETRPAQREAGGGPGPGDQPLLLCSVPRRSLGVRGARGGARAVSAGNPRGVGRSARDPQTKKPRGRSGAAVSEGSQVWLQHARLRSCLWGGERGQSPPELGSDLGPQSRRRPPGVTSSLPSLDSLGPGCTGVAQRTRHAGGRHRPGGAAPQGSPHSRIQAAGGKDSCLQGSLPTSLERCLAQSRAQPNTCLMNEQNPTRAKVCLLSPSGGG